MRRCGTPQCGPVGPLLNTTACVTVQEEKREGTADPKFPKTQFPPEDLCVGCRGDDGSWDTAATLKFLLRFYGPHATDVRGASVTTQTQQVLTDSITNEEWKLQAPQRRARDAEGSGGRAPRTSEPQTSPEDVADAGRGAEDRPQLQVEEEGIVVGQRAGSPWWHKLLWLLGVWFVVSMFCRCRWCADPAALFRACCSRLFPVTGACMWVVAGGAMTVVCSVGAVDSSVALGRGVWQA